ncbi:sigma-70 family RNA polymerase sigma factor [Agrobacterium rhizogenes]|uniref:sigma-70 family RNA polymerase sigma factor n=1 Tax=Rhizobium rhizogenes TaxID=359 RepID=UPI0015724301|nr:sigma-70 family RNA polymerase sigma factor [Rhizobium rhizogenes]NTI15682.1 sigma-70 family RNA polymerase sigma factor [Rhizobium rhizogenes]
MHITPTNFDRLLLDHIPLIRKLAYKYLPNDPQKREELVQDSLLYLLERRAVFDPAKGRFATFVWFIFRGCANSKYGKTARRRARLVVPMPTNEDGQPAIDVATVDNHDDRLDLEHALATLRWINGGDLLFDNVVNGKQLIDIAQERAVSIQAVQQKVARARARLQVALTDPANLRPKDILSEPHDFALTRDETDDTPAVSDDEREEWRPERVMMTSTSALTRWVDLLQAAGIRSNTMPSPASTGRLPVFAMH